MNRSDHDETSQRLRHLLDVPRPPADLRARLAEDLCDQTRSGRPNLKRDPAWGLTIAAGIIVLAVVVIDLAGSPRPPPLVRAALEHARQEAQSVGVQDGDPAEWLEIHGIRSLPAMFTVEMSKSCLIGSLPVKHLRLGVSAQGTFEVFIHAGATPAAYALPAGESGGSRWLLSRPRAGVVVITLFDQPGSTVAARSLIKTLFTTDSYASVFFEKSPRISAVFSGRGG